MSWCHCDDSRHYRVTGEVWERPPDPERGTEFGTGEKTVRIRCAKCGGKVAGLGSDLLTALGIPLEEIYNGRCLSEDEQITVEVDLT